MNTNSNPVPKKTPLWAERVSYALDQTNAMLREAHLATARQDERAATDAVNEAVVLLLTACGAHPVLAYIVSAPERRTRD